MRFIILYISAFLLLPGLSFGQGKKKSDKALNVIILIGDGMGTSQLSVPYLYGKQEPVFSNFENIGLVETSSATHKITDSGAGGTAIFSGIKTYNGAIGVDLDTLPERNLVEILSDKNYKTGFVTTASVTDATPAAFYAHIPDRSMQYDIANSLLLSEIDFFAGGGMQYFISTDGIDNFNNNNILVSNSELHKIKKPEQGKRYGFLLAMDGLPGMLNARGNFLPDATGIALDFLSGNDAGFLLMVEEAQIDWAGHSNDAGYLIAEMTDFEKTVRVAYDFAKKDGHTLVIVTADHETGGFTLGASGDRQYGNDYAIIDPNFSTVSHSATLVPLLAYGPGSKEFRGIFQNNDIFFKIRAALGR